MRKAKANKRPLIAIAWRKGERVVTSCDTTSYWGVSFPKGTTLLVVSDHVMTNDGYVLVTDGEFKYLVIHLHLSHMVEALDAAS